MQIDILSLFPQMFHGPLSESIAKRAIERGLVQINIHNIRDFTHDRHHTVDDYAYGGGAGMVLKPEPIFEAVEKIKKDILFIYDAVPFLKSLPDIEDMETVAIAGLPNVEKVLYYQR